MRREDTLTAEELLISSHLRITILDILSIGIGTFLSNFLKFIITVSYFLSCSGLPFLCGCYRAVYLRL